MTDIVAIEERVARHEQMLNDHGERIAAHGREIDSVTKQLAEIKVHDEYRDKSLARMESKMDSLAGKIDNVTVQIGNVKQQPISEKAELYDKVRWSIITLVIGAAGGLVLAQLGIQ